MAKQVLGRNLEMLLGGANEVEKSDVATLEKAPVSPGVRSLMRGHQTGPTVAPEVKTAPRAGVPAWYLFGGDVLLVALALIVVCKSPQPLSWQKELYCVATVILGGCLALGAICLEEDR